MDKFETAPLVSIGIPVYNGERYIAESLESILAQSYGNIEIIVSDNASQDRTREIVLSYAEKDGRIRYFRNETNLGAVLNFNRVVELASGEFFMWNSCHDLRDASAVDSYLDVLMKNPNAVLCHSYTHEIDTEGRLIKENTHCIDTSGLSMAKRIRKIVMNAPLKMDTVYGMIRRDALLKIKGPSRYNTTGPDVILLVELSLMGDFTLVGRPLFIYRIFPGKTPSQQIDALGRHNYSLWVRLFPFTSLVFQLLGVVNSNSVFPGNMKLMFGAFRTAVSVWKWNIAYELFGRLLPKSLTSYLARILRLQGKPW